MEPTTFFEHYRICTNEDESAQEVSRTGAAINYKAIDTRSHEPVRLQLIPLATIDPEKLAQLKERAETAEKLDHVNIAKTFAVGVEHDYLALVSEHLEGETTDSWIVAHGPMPADAALRVGLQVVRAIGAAAFFNLTHRAIQPSNLMIVPGQSPDGGWPFVKLLNFGLAGLDELHSDSAEASELAPTISPQFASPEQRANGEIDFRSEMYSLGATMCFLLTGAAPLAVARNESAFADLCSALGARRSSGKRFNLLVYLLRGFAAVAVLILAAAAAAEYFFPDKIPYFRRSEQIGVPVGVPDAPKFATTPSQATTAAPVAANQPAQNTSPAIAAANKSSPSVAQQDQSSNATGSNTVTSPTEIWKQIASAAKASEPASPGLGPSEPPSSSAPENSDQSSATESSQSTVLSKKRAVASNRRSTSQTPRAARDLPYEDNYDRGPIYQGRHHARVVGRTLDGRLIVRLSSGRVVILRRLNDDDIYAPRPRHRAYNGTIGR